VLAGAKADYLDLIISEQIFTSDFRTDSVYLIQLCIHLTTVTVVHLQLLKTQ
jgi:hypothetical protein